MTTTSFGSLPHRFRESSFRRYEQTIRDAVNAWPQVCVFNPLTVGLQPITFSNRLRDAKTSLLQYNWKTDVDVEKLLRIREDFIVAERGDLVLTGSKETLKTYTQLPSAQTYIDKSVKSPTPLLITAIMVCIHNRVLVGPIVLEFDQPADPATAEFFEQEYDVAIDASNPRKWIVL